MRSLIFFIRSIVYSNLFVSLCITLLTHQTYILLHIPQEHSFNVLALVFCSTFFTYNFQRIYRLRSVELLGKLIGIRLGWIIRNRKRLFFASLLSLVFSVYFMFQLSLSVFLMMIPLALFSILYVIPVLSKKKAIRDLPFAKIFVISIVWSVVMVAIPVVNYSGFEGLTQSSSLILLFEQFIFILAITLPFDVRDLRYDMESNIQTIPLYIGIKNTITLSHGLLVLVFVLKWIQYAYLEQLSLPQLIATGITIFLSGFIIAFTSLRRSELFFSGFVDGTMIIMYLGILVLEY
ncbi:MAG: hypothetical protein AB7G22_11645 [Flavobacteriales bacterium]